MKQKEVVMFKYKEVENTKSKKNKKKNINININNEDINDQNININLNNINNINNENNENINININLDIKNEMNESNNNKSKDIEFKNIEYKNTNNTNNIKNNKINELLNNRVNKFTNKRYVYEENIKMNDIFSSKRHVDDILSGVERVKILLPNLFLKNGDIYFKFETPIILGPGLEINDLPLNYGTRISGEMNYTSHSFMSSYRTKIKYYTKSDDNVENRLLILLRYEKNSKIYNYDIKKIGKNIEGKLIGININKKIEKNNDKDDEEEDYFNKENEYTNKNENNEKSEDENDINNDENNIIENTYKEEVVNNDIYFENYRKNK